MLCGIVEKEIFFCQELAQSLRLASSSSCSHRILDSLNMTKSMFTLNSCTTVLYLLRLHNLGKYAEGFSVIHLMVILSAVSQATGRVSLPWRRFTSDPRAFFSTELKKPLRTETHPIACDTAFRIINRRNCMFPATSAIFVPRVSQRLV